MSQGSKGYMGTTIMTDEINELRTEIEQLHHTRQHLEDHLRNADAEIERLRAALLDILKNSGESDQHGLIYTTGEGHARCRAIAKLALEYKP